TLRLPDPSRFAIALAVAELVGATFQPRARVPLPVTGDPPTVKSDDGAESPTLVTVPLPVPVPGKVWPAAKVMRPLLAIFNPVSVGAAVPFPKSRFKEPLALAVLFETGSAFNWKT